MENLQIAEGVSIDAVNGSFYSPGDIIMLNSNFTPTGFLSCDGSTITQVAYPALFSVLGTYYDTGLVCKLPNLNAQTEWTFPCGIVGNAVSYGGASSHTHTSANVTVTSGVYTTVAHNHSFSGNTASANENHSHSAALSPSINTSSSVANRSNGSGQGANLAIAGHTHSWGSSGGLDAANHTHSHPVSYNVSSAASDHSHSATLSTSTNTTTSYVPDNVISMRYYIKW